MIAFTLATLAILALLPSQGYAVPLSLPKALP